MQLLEFGRCGCGVFSALLFRDRFSFFQREAQYFPIQNCQCAFSAPSSQCRGRGQPAQAQETHAGWQGRDPFGQKRVQRGVSTDLLIIIEY